MSSETPHGRTKKTASAPKVGRWAITALATGLLLLVSAGPWAWRQWQCHTYVKVGHYPNDRQLVVKGEVIKLTVPATAAAQLQGLSDRPCLPKDRGMLFVFNEPSHWEFWMKQMRFSIDIIWLTKDGKVVTIKPAVSPQTYPQKFTSDQPAQLVLELAAGRTAELDLATGDTIQLN